MIKPPDFFTAQEINFLSDWGKMTYDKNNPEHVAAKDYITNTLGTKTQYWSNELVKRLPDFETFNWRIWSQRGWEETKDGKKQVLRFKPYTWARIYKKGDAEKHIFFTVGVDADKELVYKLDYYFEQNSKLNAEQKAIIENNIPSEVRWKAISVSDLANYDWDKLLQETSSFIAEHAYVYDRLIQLAWGNSNPQEVFSNTLRKKDKPTKGYSAIPEVNPSFSGIDKDYVKESIEYTEIGDAGEALVVLYEKKWLESSGKGDLATQVRIVKDGEGYDIHSFKQDGSPKYIEVKTTTGNKSAPFYYTLNEKLFAEKYPSNYVIYRLYNYDKTSNTADFFVIENPLEELLFQPIIFRVYLKETNK